MDYTLVHYRVELWEERAYSYVKAGLLAQGWPVEELVFDPDLVVQGLVMDTERGNVVKPNRFGYVKTAYHGTTPLPYAEQREAYRQTLVDLHDTRWQFLNTLFSISEAGIYLQLVDLLDAGKLPSALGYDDLYDVVRKTLDGAHLEGLLKADILADPARFIEPDPEVPLALLDQKHAGKKVLLITNSEWEYAAPILDFAFDPHLPGEMTWRDLFDVAIVNARKPAFFSEKPPAYEVVGQDEAGGPCFAAMSGRWARAAPTRAATRALVEASLGLRGSQILYVGDHVYADVRASKDVLRWRTALILRSARRRDRGDGRLQAAAGAPRCADGRERAPGSVRVGRAAGAAAQRGRLRSADGRGPHGRAGRRVRLAPCAPGRAGQTHRADRAGGVEAGQRALGAAAPGRDRTRATWRGRSRRRPTSTRRASPTSCTTRRSCTCAATAARSRTTRPRPATTRSRTPPRRAASRTEWPDDRGAHVRPPAGRNGLAPGDAGARPANRCAPRRGRCRRARRRSGRGQDASRQRHRAGVRRRSSERHVADVYDRPRARRAGRTRPAPGPVPHRVAHRSRAPGPGRDAVSRRRRDCRVAGARVRAASRRDALAAPDADRRRRSAHRGASTP